jgi:hypothetical protein
MTLCLCFHAVIDVVPRHSITNALVIWDIG